MLAEATRRDLALALENHGEPLAVIQAILHGVGSDRLGVLLDPCNALAAGDDPYELVTALLRPLTDLKIGALAATAFAALVFVLGRGPFATALKSTLAFWLIIMTYVGVNYVLGTGLHSYGFGTGAVARKMLMVGVADLALIGLCAAIYLARRAAQQPVATATAGSSRG